MPVIGAPIVDATNDRLASLSQAFLINSSSAKGNARGVGQAAGLQVEPVPARSIRTRVPPRCPSLLYKMIKPPECDRVPRHHHRRVSGCVKSMANSFGSVCHLRLPPHRHHEHASAPSSDRAPKMGQPPQKQQQAAQSSTETTGEVFCQARPDRSISPSSSGGARPGSALRPAQGTEEHTKPESDHHAHHTNIVMAGLHRVHAGGRAVLHGPMHFAAGEGPLPTIHEMAGGMKAGFHAVKEGGKAMLHAAHMHPVAGDGQPLHHHMPGIIAAPIKAGFSAIKGGSKAVMHAGNSAIKESGKSMDFSTPFRASFNKVTETSRAVLQVGGQFLSGAPPQSSPPASPHLLSGRGTKRQPIGEAARRTEGRNSSRERRSTSRESDYSPSRSSSTAMRHVSHAFNATVSMVSTPMMRMSSLDQSSTPASDSESDDEEAAVKRAEQPSLSKMLVLCFIPIKGAFGFANFTSNYASMVYTESYGMSVGALSTVTSVAKCVDFLIGFCIGHLSDGFHSRWGRRKPFVVVGGPVAAVMLFLLVNPPPHFLGGQYRQTNAASLGNASAESQDAGIAQLCDAAMSLGKCEAVRRCVDTNIAEGSLPTWLGVAHGSMPGLPTGVASASGWLAVWFLVTYGLKFCGGHTVANIPYDAMAMELTEDGDQRSQLLALKGIAGLMGYFFSIVMTVAINLFIDSSMTTQAACLGSTGTVMILLAVGLFTYGVHERPDAEQTKASGFVPSIRDLLNNGPYVNYLVIKLCLAFAVGLPQAILIFFIKYYIEYENSVMILNLSTMELILLSGFFMQPVLRLTKSMGKKEALAMLSTLLATAFGTLSFIPSRIFRDYNLIFLFVPFVSLGSISSTLIPESILADIIDYDELHSGQRRSGVYVVLETNIMQLLGIAAQVIPLLLLSHYGYQNNGGCSCGCGTKCPAPFMRWSCPGDVGYACSGTLGQSNVPFFGDPERDPPCLGEPESVRLVIIVFFSYLPTIFFLLAVIPTWLAPIDTQSRLQIVEQTKLRQSGEPAYDPLTGVALPPLPTEEEREEMNVLMHFDEEELEMYERHGFGRIAVVLAARLLIWLAACGALIFLMYSTYGTPAFEQAVSMGTILLTVALSAVIWETLRLHSLYSDMDELEGYRRTVTLIADMESNEWSHSGEAEEHHATSMQSALGIIGRLKRWQGRAHRNDPEFIEQVQLLASEQGLNPKLAGILVRSRSQRPNSSQPAPVGMADVRRAVTGRHRMSSNPFGLGVAAPGETVQVAPEDLHDGTMAGRLSRSLSSGHRLRETMTSALFDPMASKHARQRWQKAFNAMREVSRMLKRGSQGVEASEQSEASQEPLLSPSMPMATKLPAPLRSSTSLGSASSSDDIGGGHHRSTKAGDKLNDKLNEKIFQLHLRLGISFEEARRLVAVHTGRGTTVLRKAPFRQNRTMKRLVTETEMSDQEIHEILESAASLYQRRKLESLSSFSHFDPAASSTGKDNKNPSRSSACSTRSCCSNTGARTSSRSTSRNKEGTSPSQLFSA